MEKLSQLPFDFSVQNMSSFEDFLISDENSELTDSLKNITSTASHLYFIWGEEGAGKSHLLQAFCHQNDNAVYVPLNEFSQYGVEILQGLENMDIVCLDDVEAVLKDKVWEEGLFTFFNNSREQGKTLLMSASASPRNLEAQLADLSSRISWGLVYQLHGLNEEQIKQALVLKVKRFGIPLAEDVLNYILLRSPRSMKALSTVLKTLDELSLAEKRRITIPFVKDMMDW